MFEKIEQKSFSFVPCRASARVLEILASDSEYAKVSLWIEKTFLSINRKPVHGYESSITSLQFDGIRSFGQCLGLKEGNIIECTSGKLVASIEQGEYSWFPSPWIVYGTKFFSLFKLGRSLYEVYLSVGKIFSWVIDFQLKLGDKIVARYTQGTVTYDSTAFTTEEIEAVIFYFSLLAQEQFIMDD